ncbi:MAG: hypothetical protein AAF989_06285, partial [Planctomycetota bacterium]
MRSEDDMRSKKNKTSTGPAMAWVCGWIVVANLVGCGSDPETLESLRAAVNRTSVSTDDSEDISDVDVNGEAEYQPPYPDRLDPFSLPEPSGRAAEQAAGEASVAAKQVVVMGFADLESPRVILKIGKQTKVMKVNDVAKGIRVLKIEPPRVQLTMENLTWTATMF